MPSRAGARVAAAKRLVRMGKVPSVHEYLSRLVDGERWCSYCETFHPQERMLPDPGRPGGRAGRCGAWKAKGTGE